MISVERYHDFCAGHRVVGHEGKCRHLHGHNYRVYFTLVADALDAVGRVLDFTVIKARLCEWLEENWDHKFLAWEEDTLVQSLTLDASCGIGDIDHLNESIVWLNFNPTAENMAQYLVEVIGPRVLAGTGTQLISVRIEETRKCSATYTKERV